MTDDQLSLPDEEGQPIDRTQRIQTLFADAGGSMLADDFTSLCIEEGVFTHEEMATWARRYAWTLIRKALASRDEGNKPYAGPLASGAEGAWAQRKLWDEDAYFLNVETHVKQGMGNIEVAHRLADECYVRFSKRPPVPALVMD